MFHGDQWRIQDFPEVGSANSPGEQQHLPNFPKICMRLKEFGPGGRSATAVSLVSKVTLQLHDQRRI